MDNQLIPNQENRPPAGLQPGTTTLKELAFLCQDDRWLMDLIQDTEDNQMVTAPAYLENTVLSKTQQDSRFRKIHLLAYSLKVSLTAAAVILSLFAAPIFLEHPMWKSTPPGSENTALTPPHPFRPGYGQFPAPGTGQKLKDSLWQLSDYIYDLSSELLQGGNLHD